MMNIWAVANQKGGVGKTTTAVTLAGLLAGQEYRVLLVDMDPHGSLTTYFGNDPDSVESSVYDLFHNDDLNIQSLIRKTNIEHLSILPASTALATLDRQLATQQGKGLVIKRCLRQVDDDYDYVLLDCPPMLGVLMVNALAACDYLIIPVQTEFLALKGLERMIHTIAMINHARKNPLPYLIVPTLFDRRTRASLRSLQVLQQQYPRELWDDIIPVDTQFREASQSGVPASYKAPKSHGVLAYTVLLDTLCGVRASELTMAAG